MSKTTNMTDADLLKTLNACIFEDCESCKKDWSCVSQWDCMRNLMRHLKNFIYRQNKIIESKNILIKKLEEEISLSSNGGNFFPCRVGQTIYYHFQFSNKSILPFTRKAKVKKIYCSNNKMRFVVEAELMDAKEKGIMKAFNFEDFSKTVFLTREEAEAKLKEGVQG